MSKVVIDCSGQFLVPEPGSYVPTWHHVLKTSAACAFFVLRITALHGTVRDVVEGMDGGSRGCDMLVPTTQEPGGSSGGCR